MQLDVFAHQGASSYTDPSKQRMRHVATTPNRLTVHLDEDSISLLRRLETHTGMSPSATLAKLFPAHLEELWEYLTWLDNLPEGDNPMRHRGELLIHSYGPRSLIDDIKTIDPLYRTPAERFTAAMANGTEA